MARHWSTQDIPDLSGKTAVVTGANSGLGKETTRELARKGARVVMACRSETRAQEAEADIRRDVPEADLAIEILDLASLDSVRAFAERFASGDQQSASGADRLDLLYCNAGIMAIPRSETEDGFETQFGVNVLGPLRARRAPAPVADCDRGQPDGLAQQHGRLGRQDLVLATSRARRATAAGAPTTSPSWPT